MEAFKSVSGRTSVKDTHNTYVANINDLAPLGSTCRVVRKGIRDSRRGSSIETASWGTSVSTTKAATATKATTKATATSKSAATTEAASEASTTAKATTATESGSGPCEAILTHLKWAALPVVAIELLDGIASIVWRLKGNNARAFGASIRPDVDVCTNDSTVSS